MQFLKKTFFKLRRNIHFGISLDKFVADGTNSISPFPHPKSLRFQALKSTFGKNTFNIYFTITGNIVS